MAYYSKPKRLMDGEFLLKDGRINEFTDKNINDGNDFYEPINQNPYDSLTTTELINEYNNQLNRFNARVEYFNNTATTIQQYNQETNKALNQIEADYLGGILNSIPFVSLASKAKDSFDVLIDPKGFTNYVKESPERFVDNLGNDIAETAAHLYYDFSAPQVMAAGKLGAEQVKLLIKSLVLKNALWDSDEQVEHINDASEMMMKDGIKLKEIREQLVEKGFNIPENMFDPIVPQEDLTEKSYNKPDLADRTTASSADEVRAIIAARKGKKARENTSNSAEVVKKTADDIEKAYFDKRKEKARADAQRRQKEASMFNVPAGSTTKRAVRVRERM